MVSNSGTMLTEQVAPPSSSGTYSPASFSSTAHSRMSETLVHMEIT